MTDIVQPEPDKELPEVSLEDQIAFLKDCYRVSAYGYIRASGNPERLARAERGQRCLEATIRILESLRVPE